MERVYEGTAIQGMRSSLAQGANAEGMEKRGPRDGRCDRPAFGGQAVIEGVMMRGPERMAIAVRRPDGEIAVHSETRIPYSRRHALLGIPVVRGAATLVDSLTAGIGALLYSANMGLGEDEQISEREAVLSIALSVVAAVALFMVIPTLAASFLRSRLAASPVILNFAEGCIRLGILTLYLLAISRMKDVQRILQYHGAEHKVINAYDRGLDLTVEAARDMSVIHPRCGTSFLLVVALVSAVLFSFFGWPGVAMRVVLRLMLLPVVAGVSYEFIRASGRSRSAVVRALALPGMWLQKLTTREPDDGMIEVAIRAFLAAR